MICSDSDGTTQTLKLKLLTILEWCNPWYLSTSCLTPNSYQLGILRTIITIPLFLQPSMGAQEMGVCYGQYATTSM